MEHIGQKKGCWNGWCRVLLLYIALYINLNMTYPISYVIYEFIYDHTTSHSVMSCMIYLWFVTDHLHYIYKENYRHISILTVFSKMFDSIIAEQLMEHFTDIFNDMLCAYKYGCEHVLSKTYRFMEICSWWR